MNDYFLGLDCSTQSLTGIVIDFEGKKIIINISLPYSEYFPEFNTDHGIIKFEDEKVVHSYPLMWVEALDKLFSIFKEKNLDFNSIKAISGSGQQHGTIYLNEKFEMALKNLNLNKNLKEQLEDVFTRETAPIWMDSSTNKQCQEIRVAIGGMLKTIKLTGSDTFERFSGPQIRKFYQQNPKGYNKTMVIHLVSSFMASILLGENSPIDYGDGAGMNLMDIKKKVWSDKALNATAPELKQKLPSLVESDKIIGKISPYFIKKYGFNHDCSVLPWSGDNPNSLIGVGLIGKGKVAISLGTSNTYFGFMKKLTIDPQGESHVFISPTGDYMSLICFKNGALTTELIKDKFNLNWDGFSKILENSSPGNKGKIMLPYFFPEIVPQVLKPKVFRFGFDENDKEGNVRAIIESQLISIRLHSQWTREKPEIIYVTGGGSKNEAILQILADIFNVTVIQFDMTSSACLGAALRAAKAYYDKINQNKSWFDIVQHFLGSKERVIMPRSKYKKLYDDMVQLYRKYEDYAIRGGENPEQQHQNFIELYFKDIN
ncbi:MAG: xylulokinase [Candidatus Hermodarchaeota archaeon]